MILSVKIIALLYNLIFTWLLLHERDYRFSDYMKINIRRVKFIRAAREWNIQLGAKRYKLNKRVVQLN